MEEVDLSKHKIWCLRDRLTFGKYKGDTVAHVLEENTQILIWYNLNIDWFELDESVLEKAEELVLLQYHSNRGRGNSDTDGRDGRNWSYEDHYRS